MFGGKAGAVGLLTWVVPGPRPVEVAASRHPGPACGYGGSTQREEGVGRLVGAVFSSSSAHGSGTHGSPEQVSSGTQMGSPSQGAVLTASAAGSWAAAPRIARL